MSLINHFTSHFEKAATRRRSPAAAVNSTTPPAHVAITTTGYDAYILDDSEEPLCGLMYTEVHEATVGDEAATEINYTAILVFLAMQACSASMFLMLDDISELELSMCGEETGEASATAPPPVSVVATVSAAQGEQNPCFEQNQDEERSGAASSNEISHAIEAFDDDIVTYQISSAQPTVSDDSDAMALVKSMFRLLRDDRTAVMMLMLTFHSGFLHSTVVGDFTRSWISCGLGKEALVYRGFTVMVVRCYRCKDIDNNKTTTYM